MEKILMDKVVIVTGAGGGIGRESARIIAAAGAKVVLSDINAVSLEETGEILQKDGFDAICIITDICSEESVRLLVQQTVAKYGRLDGAFNNAAVEQKSKALADLSVLEWNQTMQVNLTGTFLCMKYQIPAMLASGGGSIVNTSSAAAQMAFPHGSEYITTKAGILGLTRAAAVDYGAQGIRVNAVLPGIIRTPMVQRLIDDPSFSALFAQGRNRHALKRFGESSEVGEVAKWLLSDGASFVQGASIYVDGGYSVNGG